MNPHPIFVHFPIALLTVYSVMELVRWKKLNNQPYWFYIKATFVMLGGLGALAAVATGDIAKDAIRSGAFQSPVSNYNQIANTHELFAHISIVIFGIIAACYLIEWFNKAGFESYIQQFSIGKVWRALTKVQTVIYNSPLIILAALVGLVSITITGGLGGIMVYGPDADPIFKIIYSLLFS